ncbi:UNVERIFIED_CONTAM: hypothetical protein HDU68_011162 [Siphonaria sp. JEL0065]|nr:hypothetical protein HDU68_011162 [Siphonaria sp. JEL0065]
MMNSKPFSFKLFSDIHLELGGQHALHREPYTSLLNPNGAEYLILAGDVGKPGSMQYSDFLFRAASVFKAIFLVTGNHEYYNQTKEDVDAQIITWIKSLNTQLNHPKIYLLNHTQTIYIEESNLRILGCTLWSHIPPEAANEVSQRLNDFRMIGTRNGKLNHESPRRITVQDYNSWHDAELLFLEGEIQRAKERGEQILVVTHHPPTFVETSAAEFRGEDNLIRFAFASALDRLFGDSVVCWCYGHTHFSNDIVIGGTRVVSNQPGYLFERVSYFGETATGKSNREFLATVSYLSYFNHCAATFTLPSDLHQVHCLIKLEAMTRVSWLPPAIGGSRTLQKKHESLLFVRSENGEKASVLTLGRSTLQDWELVLDKAILVLQPELFMTHLGSSVNDIIANHVVRELFAGKEGIVADICEMSVYRKGQGKKLQRDSSCDSTIVGTLIVCLPLEHTGGNLVVHRGNESHPFTWQESSHKTQESTLPSVQWAAFLSDCQYEVLPVTSGLCVMIVYNLYNSGHECSSTLQAKPVHPIQMFLEQALKDPMFLQQGGVLGFGLMHEYTLDYSREKLTAKHLKGNDADLYAIAQVLGVEVDVMAAYPLYSSNIRNLYICYKYEVLSEFRKEGRRGVRIGEDESDDEIFKEDDDEEEEETPSAPNKMEVEFEPVKWAPSLAGYRASDNSYNTKYMVSTEFRGGGGEDGWDDRDKVKILMKEADAYFDGRIMWIHYPTQESVVNHYVEKRYSADYFLQKMKVSGFLRLKIDPFKTRRARFV